MKKKKNNQEITVVMMIKYNQEISCQEEGKVKRVISKTVLNQSLTLYA